MKRYVVLIAVVVLFAAGGLVMWGSVFAKNMVKNNLTEQNITFPSAEQLKAEKHEDMLKYAGQPVDNGAKAYAYSEYIQGHLAKVAGGKTYSQVSGEFQKDKTNKTLEGQRMTLFMGETLRGLLLSAYGWGLMGVIAFWTALGLFAAAAVTLVGYLYIASLSGAKKPAKKAVAKKRK